MLINIRSIAKFHALCFCFSFWWLPLRLLARSWGARSKLTSYNLVNFCHEINCDFGICPTRSTELDVCMWTCVQAKWTCVQAKPITHIERLQEEDITAPSPADTRQLEIDRAVRKLENLGAHVYFGNGNDIDWDSLAGKLALISLKKCYCWPQDRHLFQHSCSKPKMDNMWIEDADVSYLQQSSLKPASVDQHC